ncbi:hypothetical protein BHE90_006104 [Fusarium euwallaceae]|uniref:Calcium-transporting ATPase n=1 Tax=Fusarium euwallaceae TaxID=1147111 RepID=A0A430LUI1_9HYPO|nr:hypothetical protein BHE90_006104 [Fusarium euwallaceae]
MEDEITGAPPVGELHDNPPRVNKSETEPPFRLIEGEQVPGNKFAFSAAQLHQLFESRTNNALRAFGGLAGLSAGVRTNVKAGLSADEDVLDVVSLQDATRSVFAPIESRQDGPATSTPGGYTDRRKIYGENRVPKNKPKTFLQLVWLAFDDKLMFLLTASATVSLALGIYQSVANKEGGARLEWVEGVAILIAVVVIVFATAINDYQKNYKFRKLNEKKEERMVSVTRSGQHQSISVFDVLVGDVMHIEAGDVAPADGILIEGFDIQCDESPLTGESELIVKTPACGKGSGDSFILSGTRVETGVGTCLVLSVGVNSTYGKIMTSLQDDVQETPLQKKLGVLAQYIINFGLAAGLVFFTILFIRFLVQLKDIEGGPEAKGHEFLEILILSITVVVIVVPEGLPLTVTLSLAFATTRMLKDNNLVRLLRSCETMGNATTVCSDKTGTLTQNRMTVVTGMIGVSEAFADGSGSLLAEAYQQSTQATPTARALIPSLCQETRDTLKASSTLNSTAIEAGGAGHFIGSGTETALLNFASDHLGMQDLSEERANGNILRMIPFNATRKWMATVVQTSAGRHRLLVKGAAEVIVDKCSETLQDPRTSMATKTLMAADLDNLKVKMQSYAKRSLRVIAIAYRDLDDRPADDQDMHTGITNLSDLVLLGVFGLRDPLRPEIIDSVRQCQSSGVFVRMVTGDNFFTAKAVASECGIYTAGGIAMDGPTFRRLTLEQLNLVAPRLQVLARSSPDDKLLLVSHLKGMGEVVAVTGDGTNDALALKAADIGFSMGVSGTEVAKEASDIILMDDNFTSIVKAIGWGRAVNDAAKKFLQYQFTINITAGTLTIMSALITDSSVFTVVQLLWINLIMDTFAALALSTDFPTDDLFLRKPESRTASVLTTTIWKMIVGQSIYQLAVIFALYYAGGHLFGYHDEIEKKHLQTMVFNIYVLMQFFNQFNSRRSDNMLNLFEGILKNPWFVFVQVITLAGQIIIVFFGGEAFQTVQLSGAEWGWSILFGLLTLPVGVAIRLIPDSLVHKLGLALKRCVCIKWLRRPVEDHEQEAAQHRRSGSQRFKAILPRIFAPKTSPGDVQGPDSAAIDAQVNLHLSHQPLQQSAAAVEEFDLVGAVDSARYGTGDPHPAFEVHPDTLKEDPVIQDLTGGENIPPSQNPVLLRYIAK